MIRITKKHLIVVAALVWYLGSISLGLKTVSLLKKAYHIHSNILFVLVSVIIGITIVNARELCTL